MLLSFWAKWRIFLKIEEKFDEYANKLIEWDEIIIDAEKNLAELVGDMKESAKKRSFPITVKSNNIIFDIKEGSELLPFCF